MFGCWKGPREFLLRLSALRMAAGGELNPMVSHGGEGRPADLSANGDNRSHEGRCKEHWELEEFETLAGGQSLPPTAGEPLLPAAWGAAPRQRRWARCRGIPSKGILSAPEGAANLCGSALPSQPWDSMALVQFAFDTSEATKVTKPPQWSFVIWVLCVLQKRD